MSASQDVALNEIEDLIEEHMERNGYTIEEGIGLFELIKVRLIQRHLGEIIYVRESDNGNVC